jgi:hypothetical protein
VRTSFFAEEPIGRQLAVAAHNDRLAEVPDAGSPAESAKTVV